MMRNNLKLEHSGRCHLHRGADISIQGPTGNVVTILGQTKRRYTATNIVASIIARRLSRTLTNVL